MYDISRFLTAYNYKFEWCGDFCRICLQNNAIDSLFVYVPASKDITIQVMYWNPYTSFETQHILIQRSNTRKNEKFIKHWIETYIMSDNGIEQTLRRLVQKDCYRVIKRNIISKQSIENFLRPTIQCDDDRI